MGELTANCEAKGMKEDGTIEATCGQEGEIRVHAPNITKGYWRKPEETKRTITEDKWLKTGDVGFVDENGKRFIVDRIKASFFSNPSTSSSFPPKHIPSFPLSATLPRFPLALDRYH